jgi:hypothetical protein
LADTDSERQVYVFARGDWHLGKLRAYRRSGYRWEGDVTWSEGIHDTFTEWVAQQRIKVAVAALEETKTRAGAR